MSFENGFVISPTLDVSDGAFVVPTVGGSFGGGCAISPSVEISDGAFVVPTVGGSFGGGFAISPSVEISEDAFVVITEPVIQTAPTTELKLKCRPLWHPDDNGFEITVNGPMAFKQQIYPNSNGNPSHFRIMDYDMDSTEANLVHVLLKQRL
jgi:hypothetical protein